MKTKSLFVVAAIAVTFLAACSDSSDSLPEANEHSVFLKLGNVQTKASTTRGDEAPLTNSNAVTLTDGYIYFVTDQDGIKAVYKITSTESTDINNKVIKLSDLEAGYKFTNVSGEVTSVYIVGNPNLGDNEDATMRSFTTLKALRAGVNVSISNQSNVNDLTIDGIGIVKTASATDLEVDASAVAEGDKEAIITLMPLCARIEIPNITAGGTVSAYTLQGIYVNHFYKQMPLNSVANSADLVSEQALSNFDSSVTTSLYHTYPGMCDDNATSLGIKDALVTTPTTASNVWAYQCFAAGAPRIILKLTGVTAGAGTFTGTQFLNIRGFLNAGGTEITNLEKGNVYRITGLVFNEGHLSQVPDPEDINLWVQVSVTPWTINTVTPEM
ncbi:hypothetical protein [uncultured Bacteroides sp.]|uniref:hypothetical protein n=1 Tax=uncultured Bacteroides sp. TaxID=162156 RepID=UPI002AA725E5|nr:hypothetical protein [uncultured Bacteroides sp.]